MMQINGFWIAAALLGLSLPGCDGLPAPRGYNDCILKYLEGSTSEAIARLITEACKDKFRNFAPDGSKLRELLSQEINALQGNTGPFFWVNNLSGTIYNGNKDVTVMRLRVVITSKMDGDTTTRIYAVDVSIPPYSTRDVLLTILPDQMNSQYSWRVEGAIGF